MASLNLYGTTTLPGMFGFDQNGFVQGEYQPDPAARFAVTSGTLAASVTGPVYGGVLITETVPAIDGPVPMSLGSNVTLAATAAGATGIVLSTQMYHAINASDIAGANAAPYVTGGNSVQYARFGSGLKFAVAIDPAILASLLNGSISPEISWDVTASRIVAYNATLGAFPAKVLRVEANSKVISVDATSGLPVWGNGPAALIQI
jgi:hypothetical protein